MRFDVNTGGGWHNRTGTGRLHRQVSAKTPARPPRGATNKSGKAGYFSEKPSLWNSLKLYGQGCYALVSVRIS